MLKVLINGQPRRSIDVGDRGFQYGDGVFETIKVQHGALLYWDEHVQRLSRGCQRLSIPLPDLSDIYQQARSLCCELRQGVLKIIVSRGPGARSYKPDTRADAENNTVVVASYASKPYPQQYLSEGVDLYLCKTQLTCHPQLAGIKHNNRLEQVLAAAEWPSGQYAEGIMLDAKQRVIEGTMSNVFWVRDAHLYTPDLTHCGVQGIMRDQIIKCAERNQIPFHIDHLLLETMQNADEIFLCNSIIGIWPVKSFHRQRYSVGHLTRNLMRLMAVEVA